jgi:phosphomannomutase
MTDIKFGTDGWRGIIADDFTFENVRRVAGGIAAYVLRHEDPARGVVVGYDTRFLSQQAARVTAEIIAGAGIPVKARALPAEWSSHPVTIPGTGMA